MNAYQTEHRSRPRRMGRRVELERRHRAAPGRWVSGHRTAVSNDRVGGRRRPPSPGAGVPGRSDHRRRTLLRRPDHDVTGHRRTQRRRPGLHRSLRARRRRVARRAAGAGTGDTSAQASLHRQARLRLALRGRLRQSLCCRCRPGEGKGDVRSATGIGRVGVHRRDGNPGMEVSSVLVSRRQRRPGDSSGGRDAVRQANGRHNGRGRFQPCGDGLSSRCCRRARRAGGRGLPSPTDR